VRSSSPRFAFELEREGEGVGCQSDAFERCRELGECGRDSSTVLRTRVELRTALPASLDCLARGAEVGVVEACRVVRVRAVGDVEP
jgi:hypothetical protein